MPAYYESSFRPGRQWKLDLTWKQGGSPVDITNYTGWRLDSAPPLSLALVVGSGLTLPNLVGGRIVALMTAAQTALIPDFDRVAYALSYVDPSGVPDSLLEGQLIWKPPAP